MRYKKINETPEERRKRLAEDAKRFWQQDKLEGYRNYTVRDTPEFLLMVKNYVRFLRGKNLVEGS